MAKLKLFSTPLSKREGFRPYSRMNFVKLAEEVF
jgi:hypothetical protein